VRNRWLIWVGTALLILGGILYLVSGSPGTIELAILGLVLVIAGLLVGRRYGKELEQAPDGFVFTGERFVDPGSHRTIEVWQHPTTSRRVYVLAKDSERPDRGS